MLSCFHRMRLCDYIKDVLHGELDLHTLNKAAAKHDFILPADLRKNATTMCDRRVN